MTTKRFFDLKDVYNTTNATSAHEYLNKQGYMSCSIEELRARVDNNKLSRLCDILDECETYRFITEYGIKCLFFLPEDKVTEIDTVLTNQPITDCYEFLRCIKQAKSDPDITLDSLVGTKIYIKSLFAKNTDIASTCCLITAISIFAVTFGGREMRWDELSNMQFAFDEKGPFHNFVYQEELATGDDL